MQSTRGEVGVRHGVTEAWTPVGAGRSAAAARQHEDRRDGSGRALRDNGGRAKTITLPPEVIVDMSDIRDLSQEELMLKLTMEKVRGSSYQWNESDPAIPNAGVIHGSEKSSIAS